MKTIKTFILTSLIALFCAAVFFSCDVPLALGNRLDIKGPVVEFTAPAPRKAVGDQFNLEGTVFDESPIDRMLIRTSKNNVDFPKQWRYARNAGWQVSENNGANWTAYPVAQWNGDEKSASWVLPVDLAINGVNPEDGEYMFTVQAWDTGGFTDDNSFKTLVLIYDIDPPIVVVFNPFLYDKYQYDGSVFKGDLLTLADAATWKEPYLIGKFLTQEFQLQWQIEDQHDVWSIELLFYEHDAVIDGFVETEVPQDYIYYYHENLPPPELDPTKNIKPNGGVLVPDLGGSPGQYNGGTLSKTLTDKTIIKVVSICYDAAGWVNQEKVLGYFVFWPQAAQPWITFTEGMENPNKYIDETRDEAYFNENAFMVYPGRNIRATAFQTQGVSKVEFTLHSFTYDGTAWTTGEPMGLSYMLQLEGGENTVYTDSQRTRVKTENQPRPNGSYSTIFPWDFKPLARSANYVVRAQAYDSIGRPSEVYEAAFRVQDITFPDFPKSPYPSAGEPLFKFISRSNGDPDRQPDTPAPAGSIIISGVIADATAVESLYMVWINPQSISYSAMSQLSYFRDANYGGWRGAIQAGIGDGSVWVETSVTLINDDGSTTVFTPYDSINSNKVWKIPVTRIGEDPDTQRIWFRYSLTLNLSNDLNIDTTKQALTSQVFLLKAMNPDKKSTIITYAPQGDTVVPTLKIDEVEITGGTRPDVYTPGAFAQVPQFTGNETIIVRGKWTEDSTEYLNSQAYFYNNMAFTINGINITGAAGSGTTVTINPADVNAPATDGTFTLTARVNQGVLNIASLKDTLVVNATVSDIGKNPAEDGASWLIESDTLRFLRISSLDEDKAYKAGDTIEIFLEFNKPVRLKPNRSQNPVLVLNPTGGANARAYYKANQASENTRHFFTYAVAANQNTSALNVLGISIVGGTNPNTSPPDNQPLAAGANDWTNANYPFTFVHTNIEGKEEEIRLTTDTAHRDSATGNGVLRTVTGQTEQVWARVVPVTTASGDADYIFTLIGGKRISVDNTPPAVTTITATPTGWHKAGVEIYITATFNKPVRKGAVLPQLQLGSGRLTSNNDADVRVNNTQITFRYTVQPGDSTGTNPLQVTGLTGQILDIPGTPMATLATTTLTGTGGTGNLYLDNTAPGAPGITVTGGGTTFSSVSVPATLYHNSGSIQINGAAGPENLGRVEYTLNGNLATPDWTSVTTATHTINLVNVGSYNIKTRQIDQAGNSSNESALITFRWDPGDLITRISSSAVNGLYTHNQNFGNGRTIPITIYFRRPVTISDVSGITLNAVRGTGNGTPIVLSESNIVGTNRTNIRELTFNYVVQNETAGSGSGDRTPVTNPVTYLDVTNLGTITATDGTIEGGNDVPVTSFLTAIPASRLNVNKQIQVQTGSLSDPNPTFTNDTAWGTQGIQADGSYWTTLQIVFNHDINKGTAANLNITIKQIEGSGNTAYRLPAVLTESQYNRFRGIANFNTYYTKGTNGYITGQGSDTSTKYVLGYNYNPNSGRGAVFFTNDALPDSTFFSDFRTAEAISLSVDSQAVEVSGTTLKVRLTGSNAPQVPGATYEISYPSGLVIDNLGNSSAGRTNFQVTLGGVAKPFVRIKKTQDLIGARQAAGLTSPTLTATQPSYAYVRMDSRTPGSSIAYWGIDNPTTYTANATNWNATTGASPSTPTRPTISGTGTSYNPQPLPVVDNPYGIRIGNANHEGLKYWIVARASLNSGNSAESDEMAYRTAITYRLAGMALADTTGQQFMREGGQIWIRGGDSLGSSSIPGFPLTWEDNFDSLRADGKRAGIRLMTLLANSWPNNGNMGTTAAGTSTWHFLTWEINATAYVDFILGHDRERTGNDAINDYNTYESASINEVWQYGPRYWALQRGGWAGSKTLYPVYPGEIRYLATNVNNNNVNMNFSAAFNSRPSNGRQNATTPTGNTLPVTVANPNTNNY